MTQPIRDTACFKEVTILGGCFFVVAAFYVFVHWYMSEGYPLSSNLLHWYIYRYPQSSKGFFYVLDVVIPTLVLGLSLGWIGWRWTFWQLTPFVVWRRWRLLHWGWSVHFACLQSSFGGIPARQATLRFSFSGRVSSALSALLCFCSLGGACTETAVIPLSTMQTWEYQHHAADASHLFRSVAIPASAAAASHG